MSHFFFILKLPKTTTACSIQRWYEEDFSSTARLWKLSIGSLAGRWGVKYSEWCVYCKGFGLKYYSTQILIQLTALSALGLTVYHVCEWMHMGVSCMWVCACVFTSTLLQTMLPSIFHYVAYNTHYLSPLNIYLMPTVHLCSAYKMCICMRPEIILVMTNHST